jgi:SulP family sulfate permease
MQEAPTQTAVEADEQPEVNQPGLGELREAVANYLVAKLPGRASLRRDALAGLSSAISNVPDGMANGVLVGVNPVYGLYATMLGPAVGGLFSSTQLMLITTTAAASLSTSQALGGLEDATRASTLFLLVILIGVFQIVFGLLGLGRLIRFVSYSVTTGFLTGVSALLILNQLPVVTGYEPAGSNRVIQTINLLLNIGRINLLSLALAALTLLLAVLLPRTPLSNFGRLVAIVVPSVLVALFGLTSVEIVRDVGEIPRGVPMPVLPSLSDITPDVLTGALAVSMIILVQGAGVSQSVPNPDGSRRSTSRDFIAQGASNVASGLFRGLPVGGSLSATALNLIYGAQTRWAVVFAGVWMALIVMIVPGLVSYIAMPALGALLILAGASSIKPHELRAIWRLGWSPRIASVVTFLATLFLSIQAAVGIGVALTALLYVNRSSTDISVVELVKRPDGKIEERDRPKQLPSNTVTVLDVYGHLFYAGAQTLEGLLPRPQDAESPVVILRLRGLTRIGATLLEVLARYADKLEAANGRLYLSGISEHVHDQIVRTGKLQLSGPVQTYKATAVRGQSTHEAVADARAWLVHTSQTAEAPSGDAHTSGNSRPMDTTRNSE